MIWFSLLQWEWISFLFLISSGMRHFAREKVLGPAKPLWFLKGCGFTLDAGEVYQVC